MAEKNLYKNGKVYKLVNDVDDEIYIGSTCNPLCKRICGHRADAKRKPEQPVYRHLNTIGWPNVHIILIENYPCDNVEQLRSRERYYIDLLKPVLNKVIPNRTDKEYRSDNIDKIKEYRMANKDKIKEYYAIKYICLCGSNINTYQKAKHEQSTKHKKFINEQKNPEAKVQPQNY